MDNQNNIQDELKDLNSGLPVNKDPMPFSVPEGYFDGLAGSILAKIKAQDSAVADELRELSPLLASLSRKMPYSVPDGYFEENVTTLPYLLQDENSPVLAAIGKDLPYKVPQGYFENLPKQVLSKVNQPKAKVVPLFARKFMRVAVAAVLGGAILLGGYQLLNSPGEGNRVAVQQPADTSKKLVAKNEPPVVQDIRKVSTKELDEFIKTAAVNPLKLQKTPVQANDAEIDNLLKGVSKTEIDTFLDQLPTADEDLAVID